jgi:hypothetical protein
LKTNNPIKYIISVFILISCFTIAHAQVPGFLGKKLTLSAGAYAGYSIGAPAKVGSTNAGIDKRFFLGADYVIGRKWTAGIEYQKLSSALSLTFDNAVENATRVDEYTYALKANTFKFSFTHFGSKSNFLAPVGRYFTLGFLMVNYTISDDKGYMFNAGRDLFKGHNIGFSFDVGKRRVLYKQLVVDYAAQLALVIPNKNSESGLQNEFAQGGADRLLAAHLVTFKLGLGWLIL